MGNFSNTLLVQVETLEVTLRKDGQKKRIQNHSSSLKDKINYENIHADHKRNDDYLCFQEEVNLKCIQVSMGQGTGERETERQNLQS